MFSVLAHKMTYPHAQLATMLESSEMNRGLARYDNKEIESREGRIDDRGERAGVYTVIPGYKLGT